MQELLQQGLGKEKWISEPKAQLKDLAYAPALGKACKEDIGNKA